MSELIEIYTDGACKGNPGPGGWAWVHMAGDDEVVHDAGCEDNTTNNRMELTAVIEALRSFSDSSQLLVHTDSTYVVKGVNEWLQVWKRKGWVNSQKKPVVNKQLWCSLDDLVHSRDVRLDWVKGHVDVLGNIKADKYASDQAVLAEKKLPGGRA